MCLFWKYALGNNLMHEDGDGREGEKDKLMSVCVLTKFVSGIDFMSVCTYM